MQFDPFGDRLARDIRNGLSTALVEVLTRKNSAALTAEINAWLGRIQTDPYLAYINQQQQVYQDLLAQVDEGNIKAPREQAIMLWNAGLYFELHELLETIWHGAREPDRTGLKGLIQAAGAYVHSRRGKTDAAGKLALKACTHLRMGAPALSFVANLDELITALGDSPPTPVRLVYREEM